MHEPTNLDDEISRCFIGTLVETFREPEFDITTVLKFVEYNEGDNSFEMRFENFATGDSTEILGAWTITLPRANDQSHLEDHHG